MQGCNCGMFLFQIRAGGYELTEPARLYIYVSFFLFFFFFFFLGKASDSKIHNKKERPERVFFFVSLETTVTFRFNDFLVILMWEYYCRAHRWGNIRIEIC